MGFLNGAFSWPLVAAQVCLVVVSVILWRRYMSPLSNIPGPALASFSRLWHLRHIYIGDQNLQLIRLHDEYGHFVRIAHDEVSVSHPDGIKKLYLSPVPKSYWYAGITAADYRFVAPFSITNPKAKVELSKAFAPGYTLTNILQMEGIVDNTIEALLGWMDKYAETRQPMPLDRFLHYTAFDVVGDVLFSAQFGFLKAGKDIGDAIAGSWFLNFFTGVSGFYGTWRKLLMNPFTTWLDILPMTHVFNKAVRAVDERRKNPDAPTDIIAHWFKAIEKNPGRVTLRNVYAQAGNNVGAGVDTVACALMAFMYFMLRHPTALGRVRDEIQAAEKEGLCKTKVVSYADAQRLPYLQMCIKEALRIFSPVTQGLPRTVPAGGITIGDRTFPEGTVLSISQWVMHQSTELWGPDAREFNPDRWLREDAAALEKKYYMPFGAGFESCPGHHVAKMELSKITATILRDYDIRQVDQNQEWQWKAYFTVVPRSCPVYVNKRGSSVNC
ncbi:cytochrome P450 [Xylariaceae sp. FL0662B]|nr:cytochrome P450 [Xylariaceae sp. FL0662B]